MWAPIAFVINRHCCFRKIRNGFLALTIWQIVLGLLSLTFYFGTRKLPILHGSFTVYLCLQALIIASAVLALYIPFERWQRSARSSTSCAASTLAARTASTSRSTRRRPAPPRARARRCSGSTAAPGPSAATASESASASLCELLARCLTRGPLAGPQVRAVHGRAPGHAARCRGHRRQLPPRLAGLAPPQYAKK